MRKQGYLHIFHKRQVRKDSRDLKSPSHSQSNTLVGSKAGQIASLEFHAARVRNDESGKCVEECAFAGAVWTNDGVEFTATDLKGDPPKCLYTAKAFGHGVNRQYIGGCVHERPRSSSPARPRGITSTSSMMMIPMNSGQYSVLPLMVTSRTTYTAAPTAGPRKL